MFSEENKMYGWLLSVFLINAVIFFSLVLSGHLMFNRSSIPFFVGVFIKFAIAPVMAGFIAKKLGGCVAEAVLLMFGANFIVFFMYIMIAMEVWG